ncbi:hypothetical protein [Roseivivax sp. THAF197b]|uniref:hypothetical protein n=1 Tax=Roseivivax sp. THAF197b TaxID=2588299 RepID=UPI0012A9597D|nr:hypothetical protein [Roseivivax sp. THAF197b]QFS83970.1 hypothetical protein FIV09_14130 [Roseivivax sp. THAF197b]
MNRPTHDLRWQFADKMAAVLVVLAVMITALWLAVPSGIFIKTISLDLQDRTVRFVRELPFGTVDARWRSEITLIDGGGFECNSGDWGLATYQAIPGNTVTYHLGAWADDCLEAGPPLYLTTTRQVMLLGVIPLRQDVSVTEIEGNREPGEIFAVDPEG